MFRDESGGTLSLQIRLHPRHATFLVLKRTFQLRFESGVKQAFEIRPGRKSQGEQMPAQNQRARSAAFERKFPRLGAQLLDKDEDFR